jgi:hypothetical protein
MKAGRQRAAVIINRMAQAAARRLEVALRQLFMGISF